MLQQYKRYLLFFFLFFCEPAFSQQYNFKVFSTKNGLANSSVNNIFQDSRGYIWFATQGGGVSRFDGKKFKNYTSKDGLVGNDITCFLEDNKGNLWIATYGNGVSCFDGTSFKNYTEKEGLANNFVYSIYKDMDGKLWLSTFGGGISVFDGKNFKNISTKDGLPTNNIFCVIEEKKGIYWIGTYTKGLCIYDGNTFVIRDSATNFRHKSVFRFMKDDEGHIWIGSAKSNGVSYYDGNKFVAVDLPYEIDMDMIADIIQDKHKNIWIATEHGLIKYNKGKESKVFTEKEGLSNQMVQALMEDYEGNLWIGTYQGVVLFKSEAFVVFTEKEGLKTPKVSALYKDSRGNYLIGTFGGGLYVFDGQRNFSSVKGLEGKDISTIAEDKKGNIYLSALDELYFLECKGRGEYVVKNSWKEMNGKAFSSIAQIITSRNGDLWIATYGSGVFCISPEKTILYNDSNVLSTNNTLRIFEDSKGRIWLGSYQGDLIVFENGQAKKYGKKDGLPDDKVWAICEDKRGRIFLGTQEAGLVCFDGKKFKTFSIEDGLCSNYIKALVVDDNNDLWVGTEKGINKVRISDLLNIISNKYYGEEEGFEGVNVYEGALYKDDKGVIWIGSENGLTRFDSRYDYRNTTPPRIVLMGIRLSYEAVNWNKMAEKMDSKTKLPIDLKLSYKNSHITFDFQALTTDNVKYTFVLEGGGDEKWSPLSGNTEASFPNIQPGNYTFKVKAQNSDGIWSRDTIVYSFTISPPFYQTLWFFISSVIVILISIVAFIQWRTAKLANEKKVLEEKVTERTLELEGANKQLSLAYGDITDSIQYAKKIQESILPLDEDIRHELPESFVLFMPRDVVSGDFYWFNEKDGKIFIAAVDCTGHGVPGAFMSMIGNTLLNEIVNEIEAADPAVILNHLNQGIRKSLKQDREMVESKDGMDIAICVIDKKQLNLKYAGAKRPLYLFTRNKDKYDFSEVRSDRMSIGGMQMDDDTRFTSHSISIKKGDAFYIFTDGIVDQFGGERSKKFSSKQLRQLLGEIQELSMKEQKVRINTVFGNWKGKTDQIDDVLLIGVRI